MTRTLTAALLIATAGLFGSGTTALANTEDAYAREAASQGPLPCQYEDGNPDGSECIWTDADTGTDYLVSSENYR